MDATSSAYQLMYYFKLNKDMGLGTNLMVGSESTDLFHDFLSYNVSKIYGKHLYICLKGSSRYCKRYADSKTSESSIYASSIWEKVFSSDVLKELGFTLTKADANELTAALYKLRYDQFPSITNLMSLVNGVGWLCSFLDRPVLYHGEHLTTLQDYVRSSNVSTTSE